MTEKASLPCSATFELGLGCRAETTSDSSNSFPSFHVLAQLAEGRSLTHSHYASARLHGPTNVDSFAQIMVRLHSASAVNECVTAVRPCFLYYNRLVGCSYDASLLDNRIAKGLMRAVQSMRASETYRTLCALCLILHLVCLFTFASSKDCLHRLSVI